MDASTATNWNEVIHFTKEKSRSTLEHKNPKQSYDKVDNDFVLFHNDWVLKNPLQDSKEFFSSTHKNASIRLETFECVAAKYYVTLTSQKAEDLNT